MQTNEIIKLIEKSLHDSDKIKKLFNVMDIVYQDIHYVRFSRETFLPSAKAYLEGRMQHNDKFRLRQKTGSLGGSSRWLYYRQKQLFKKLLNLWLPDTLSESKIDILWQKVKSAESRLLKNSRKNYLDKRIQNES